MTSLRAGMSPLRGCARPSATPWQLLRQSFRDLRLESRSIITQTQVQFSPMDADHSLRPGNEKDAQPVLAHARAFPVSPSYFTRQERFTDQYVRIKELFRRYRHLPAAPPEKVRRVAWRKLAEHKAACGEPIKASDFAQCMDMVKHLHKIHPDLKPPGMQESLEPFLRDITAFANRPRPAIIDRFGRTHGVGRRKTSVARAWLVEGNGEVLVNGKVLSDVFARVHDRESATWALRATERVDKYNVWALVHGGGTTGQAEAMTLAVAKALMAHEPALKPALRRAGCVTRDPRMVERKKPGHLKARKMPAWVKR